MIGLTCEICSERFDIAGHEGPSRDAEAADWVVSHHCGGRIMADAKALLILVEACSG